MMSRVFWYLVVSGRPSSCCVDAGGRPRGLLAVACALVTFMALGASAARASAPCGACSPWWHVTSGARPTYLPPAETGGSEAPGAGQIVVRVSNLGDGPALGESSPVTVTDTLPPGLVAATGPGSVVAVASGDLASAVECSVVANVPSCVLKHALPAFAQIEMIVNVHVEPGAHTGEKNTVSVTGGGASPVSISRRITVPKTELATPFGVEQYELTNEEAGGAPDTQAGSHPFQTTFTVGLNQSFAGGGHTGLPEATSAALPKDLDVRLPPGLVGNPTPFPRCPLAQFFHKPRPTCSPQTVLGVAITTFNDTLTRGLVKLSSPVYNLEPEVGEPARFGYFVTSFVPVFTGTSVRSGEDYAIMGNVENITETAPLISSEITLWGTPGDPRHDLSRGEACLEGDPSCQALEETHPAPFFELPTSCAGELSSSIEGDSWSEPLPSGSFPTLATTSLPALHGCNRLPFHPTIKVTPDGSAASSATGLTVDVHNPQTAGLNPAGLGEANVKNITVTLPEGVGINPAGGDGLEACSEGLVGFEGFRELPSLPGIESAVFKPWLAGSVAAKAAVAAGSAPALEQTLQPGINFCANASKVGTAKIDTPLLANPIEGAVYLAAQNENPFGSLIAIYIVAEDPVSGVLIRLAGQVRLTETGQLVASVENNPEAPFEDAELHFFGGERAPLASPARCGPYTTTASFTPWSAEQSDETALTVDASSTFDISSGPGGTPCPGSSLPFSPTLTGGSTNINAGSFTPLTTTIGREDGQQNLQSVALDMPAGLEGLLSGVKLCPEAEANEGACGPESLIGETTVSAGVGSDPVTVKGGRVYITEKYAGAPFGLSIVNPVKAGPFDLEHDTSNPSNQPSCDCVVVRAKIEVDPATAQLTITTDGSGPHAIPRMIDGVPVQIKKVNVLINRPNFTFNPTNCDPTSITGTIGAGEGASSPVSVPLQVTNCARLTFAPKFAVSTSGRTSKANGASLSAKVSYPQAPQGTFADIGKVKVELPKQLPSRLTTLQKACTSKQFEANAASCPAESVIGHATVLTPLLPVPLTGPAIFVSHGGEAFPSLVIVLQGYGVTVQLVGTTFISKAGITSTTFKTVPDTPFSTFELTLPQGRFSALAANGNLCTSKLAMPTEFVGQNGAVIRESTPISVTGCAKKKAQTRAQKLAAALKACNKKPKSKRATCRRLARKKYGPLNKKRKR